jgi:hypothetical protein
VIGFSFSKLIGVRGSLGDGYSGFSPMVPSFLQGTLVGNLSTSFPEPSGIARPNVAANSGYLWMEQDSGNPSAFLAVNLATMAASGSWTLGGISQVDFEDCTSFVKNGIAYLVMGDTGDNTSVRATIVLYRMPEPTITGSDGTISAGSIETITCQYPVANVPALKDCECIFADPATGDIYLITKRIFPAQIYQLPYAASYVGTQNLTYLGKLATDTSATSTTIGTGSKAFTTVSGLAFPIGMRVRVQSRASQANWMEGEVTANAANSLTIFIEAAGATNASTGGSGTFTDWDISLPISYTPTGNNGCVTGGAIAPYGNEICLVNYFRTFIWQRTGSQTIFQALSAAPTPITGDILGGAFYSHDIPGFPQREAVEYSSTGDLYSIGEWISGQGATNPLIKYTRASKAATTLRLQNGLNSYAGAVDTYIGGTGLLSTDQSATNSLIADIDFGTGLAFTAVASASAGTMIDLTVSASTTYVAGLGCQISGSSVAAYNGHWEVDSKPSGTVVRLKCPYVSNATGTATPHTQDRAILLAFTDLTAIPAGATIIDAKLRLYINTEGKGFQVHRMKIGWTGSSTWTSLSNGVFPDAGVDAEAAKDSYVPTSALDTYLGFFTVNIPVSTITNWINGSYTNNGWIILQDQADATGDGLQIDSSESATQSRKPMLIISYIT